MPMLRSDPAVKKALSRHLVSSAKLRASKRPPNPYDSKCPTRIVLDRIADKWTVLVLGLLSQRPLRFNQLRREIDGLTQKMLSQTLRLTSCSDGRAIISARSSRRRNDTTPPRRDKRLCAGASMGSIIYIMRIERR